jgi:hypothetical protein
MEMSDFHSMEMRHGISTLSLLVSLLSADIRYESN